MKTCLVYSFLAGTISLPDYRLLKFMYVSIIIPLKYIRTIENLNMMLMQNCSSSVLQKKGGGGLLQLEKYCITRRCLFLSKSIVTLLSWIKIYFALIIYKNVYRTILTRLYIKSIEHVSLKVTFLLKAHCIITNTV